MTTRFVILAAPRTGTNTLVAQLCAQPDIWCHGEILKRGKVPIKRPGEKLKEKLLKLREQDFDAFLARAFTLSKSRPHCGFKILLAHLNEQNTPPILDDPGILKIVLFRSNILANYASTLTAKETGAWNPQNMSKTQRPLVEFRPARFKQFRALYEERYRGIFERLAANGQNPFRLHTDELNNASRIEALLAFLGAETAVATREMLPGGGSSDILSRFTNPARVEQYLRAHKLMHWAQEGPAS